MNHSTDDKLSSINISKEVIFQLIKNLDPYKAHGQDEISVKLLKLCAPSICKQLTLLFENCYTSRKFPNVWKKIILFQSIKKDKQLIKNYRPVSLLLICEKLMEKLVLNSIFNFTDTRKMLSVFKSRFHPSDACVSQLILSVLDIYNTFDTNSILKRKDVFLDIC